MKNLPSLGARFDVYRIESGSYGIACWQVFWEAVNPADLAGATLYEGDTAATMDDRENVFCIAIQSSSPGMLGAVKAALASHARFNELCAPPRFVEGAECAREPLVLVGTIGAGGAIVGDAWNARPGLEAARRSSSRTAVLERLFERWDYDAVQELERLASALPIRSLAEAGTFFAAAAKAADTTVKPVERRSGQVFDGLRGVVSASDRKDFKALATLASGYAHTGVLFVETFDRTIGVLFCAIRVADSVFMTYAFTGGGREGVKELQAGST